jgi:hypothetical protein
MEAYTCAHSRPYPAAAIREAMARGVCDGVILVEWYPHAPVGWEKDGGGTIGWGGEPATSMFACR